MGRYALLVGISEYEPGLDPLPSAAKDLEVMQRILKEPEIGGFAESDIVVLHNQQRQEIETAIFNLFHNRHKDDLLLFYFSGHGILDSYNDFYLSTRSTRKLNGNLISPTAVAARTIHDLRRLKNQSSRLKLSL